MRKIKSFRRLVFVLPLFSVGGLWAQQPPFPRPSFSPEEYERMNLLDSLMLLRLAVEELNAVPMQIEAYEAALEGFPTAAEMGRDYRRRLRKRLFSAEQAAREGALEELLRLLPLNPEGVEFAGFAEGDAARERWVCRGDRGTLFFTGSPAGFLISGFDAAGAGRGE